MVSNDGADDEEGLGAKRLCSACVGESFLQAEIDAHGEDAICSYCGSAGKTFSIEEMADRVETAFEHHFRRTADQPSGFEYAMMKEDGRGFEREGDRVADVIEGVAEIDQEPAEDIRSVLEDRNWDREMAQMGDEGPFDSDTHYTEATPDDAELHSEWLHFERSIKTEARFFSRSAEAALASVFEGLKTHKTRDGRAVITEAGPGKKLSGLFRARVFQSDVKLEAALMRPDREVGPPPSPAATAGRMNARGISVFYGASTPKIALAEVRPPVGSKVAIGRFNLIRPIKLLNVEALRSLNVSGSFFDPSYIRRLERAKFLERLSHRISMPIMPDDEPFDYLVTQAIADYLATEAAPALDGIIYPSGQGQRGGFNVVLFHKSAQVEPLDLPAGTELSAHLYQSTEDGPEIDYTVWEETPPAATLHPKHSDFPDFSGILSSPWPFDDELREATLRLDMKTVEIHHIERVTFHTSSFPVSRHRFEKRLPDF